jgi:cell division protein FtsB
VNEVVHGVLSEKTKKNKFLQNVGILIVQPASIEQNSQEDLAAENAELRTIINAQHSQLEELSKEVQETKEARSRDKEEMKKMQTEMDAKLELVLS